MKVCERSVRSEEKHAKFMKVWKKELEGCSGKLGSDERIELPHGCRKIHNKTRFILAATLSLVLVPLSFCANLVKKGLRLSPISCYYLDKDLGYFGHRTLI